MFRELLKCKLNDEVEDFEIEINAKISSLENEVDELRRIKSKRMLKHIHDLQEINDLSFMQCYKRWREDD